LGISKRPNLIGIFFFSQNRALTGSYGVYVLFADSLKRAAVFSGGSRYAEPAWYL
jgi:hypothetical protein